MFVTAGVSGASIVYVLVANGVEVVATETAQAICKELGLSPTATIAITALTGIMVAGGMSALLVQMNRAGAVQLGEGALEVVQSADDLVKPNQLDEIVEVGDDAAKACHGGLNSEFDKLLNSEAYKQDFGYDCSEIAQDFMDTANGNGKMYRIEGKNGFINGYEYNSILEFDYHEVYSDEKYIYDPRFSNVPIEKGDYFRALKEINPNGFDVFTK